nr:hypothetical protein [Tanacetum cinerariifolium]
VETPLFENILEVKEVDAEEEVQVPAQDNVDQENVTEEIADDVAQPTSPLPPSPDLENVFNQERINVDIDEGIELVVDQEKDAEIEGRQADTQEEVYNIDLDHSSKVLKVQEAVEIVTTAKLMTEVVTTAVTQVVAASTPIPAAKPVVVDVSTPISAAKPAAKPKVLKIVAAAPTVSTRKRKGVIIRDPEEELHDDTLAETISMKDKGKGILVEDPKPMKKRDQIEMDVEYARKLQEEEESHVQAKGIQYIRRYHGYKKKPQSKSEACKNMIAYLAVSTPFSAAKPAAKPKVLKIAAAAPAVSTRKRKGVVIRDPEEELHDDTPAETQSAKDKGIGILVEDPKPMKKKDQIEMDAERYHGYKKKPQSESEACKNMIDYLKNTEGFKMAFFKGKTYDQISPIFQARFDANMRFLLKSKEEMEKEQEEIIKSINETSTLKAAMRRRLREQAKEDENLKKQLEVVVDEDDDVFIKATPIGTKVPVVNYEIVMINNKPRYKIIRADDTHQLYTSFITLLKNFDREDLENLWKTVKARFSTSKPTNF